MKPSVALRVLLALVLVPASAPAVFKLEKTLEQTLAEEGQVFIARISKVRTTETQQVVEAELVEQLKGKDAPGKMRFLAAKAKLIAPDAAVGQSVIVLGREPAMVHLGNRWLRAAFSADEGFRFFDAQASMHLTFPGRSDTLALVLKDVIAGKAPLLNEVEDRTFRGKVTFLGKLPADAGRGGGIVDFDGDGAPELIIGTGKDREIYTLRDGKFARSAYTLSALSTPRWAIGDANGDGKPDLLDFKSIYLNNGKGFERRGVLNDVDEPKVIACALIDANGDDKPDCLTLLRDGTLLIDENPGGPDATPWKAVPPGKLWTDAPAPQAALIGNFAEDGSAAVLVAREDGLWRYSLKGGTPDPFFRLAGELLSRYHSTGEGKLANASLHLIDPNCDGRTDVLLVADGLGMVLFNRGRGAFFASVVAAQSLLPSAETKPPFTLSSKSSLLTWDFRKDKHADLLVISPDGTVHQVENPKP